MTDPDPDVRTRAVDAAKAVLDRALKLYSPPRHNVEEALDAAAAVYDADHDATVKRLMDESLLLGMTVGPDGLTLKATMARELAMRLVGAAKQFLDENPGAENYIEQEVVDRDSGDRYVVIFVKPGGRSPHELRRAAEARLVRQQLEVEAWLERHRDQWLDGGERTGSWWVVDGLLDDLREHVATGVPLSRPTKTER